MSRLGPLCHDMGLRWQWATMSGQESYVATGFLSKQGGLGRDRELLALRRDRKGYVATGMGLELSGLGPDRDPSFATKACWPCVTIENIPSRQTLGWCAARARQNAEHTRQGSTTRDIA